MLTPRETQRVMFASNTLIVPDLAIRMCDCVHPNDRGHQMIVDHLEAVVRDLVE